MTVAGMILTQRDVYVHLAVEQDGQKYNNSGPCRCYGTCPGWDCSGLCLGRLLVEAGGKFMCGNTDSAAAWLIANHRTCDWATARATAGAWAIRTTHNSLLPGDGHMVISLGDGRTIEAHSHADGVIIGHFDGVRGFQVFGFPDLLGFNMPHVPPVVPTGPSGSVWIQLSESDPDMILCPWKKSRVPGRVPFYTLDIANKCVWGHDGASLANDQPTPDPNLRKWPIGASHAHPAGLPISTPLGMSVITEIDLARIEQRQPNSKDTNKPVAIIVGTADHGTFIGEMT